MDFVRHMFFEGSDSSVIVLPRPSAEDRRVLYSSGGRHFYFCEAAERDQGGTPQYSGASYTGHVIRFYLSVNDIEGTMTYTVGANRIWFRGREYSRNENFDLDEIMVHEYEGEHLLELVKPLPNQIGPTS